MNNYLASFNILSKQEIEHILNIGTYKTIEKNYYFNKEGGICSEVAFIVSGIFRSFYLSSAFEEVTYCFTFPNNFITAYSSFISQKKSLINIQALTKVELFVLSKDQISKLESTSNNWLKFSKIMAEQEYMELERRIFLLQKEKATKKYQDLLDHSPELLQQIPLNHLASYLGITQRHLSRIRKEIFI